MIPIARNMALKPFNTFGVASSARYFAAITKSDEVRALLDDPELAGQP
ncbi:MAG: hypothetical protein JJV98_02185, partial [Desulfosarcina sp.]|nr:hypothetical protein [Desulfobacterales bacterium]